MCGPGEGRRITILKRDSPSRLIFGLPDHPAGREAVPDRFQETDQAMDTTYRESRNVRQDRDSLRPDTATR